MKFQLDFEIEVNEAPILSAALLDSIDEHRDHLGEISAEDGRVVILVDGEDQCGEYAEPVVRLVGQWVRKLQWVVGGDTETIPFRNSEHCFAFVPAGQSIELSFHEGTELEIEDYVIEPFKVRLDTLVHEILAMGDRLVGLVKSLDESLLTTDEDCKDLLADLEETRKTWHDYELHNR